MRYLTALCLAASATAILAFGGAQAKPSPQQLHVMTVELPFGGEETIRYAGTEPPTVQWSDDKPFAGFVTPFWGIADFDRIAAMMNQQMVEFDRQIAAMQRETARASSNTTTASAGNTNGGYCAETVEMTQTGNQAPHIVRHTYGACGTPSPTHTEMPAGQHT